MKIKKINLKVGKNALAINIDVPKGLSVKEFEVTIGTNGWISIRTANTYGEYQYVSIHGGHNVNVNFMKPKAKIQKIVDIEDGEVVPKEEPTAEEITKKERQSL